MSNLLFVLGCEGIAISSITNFLRVSNYNFFGFDIKQIFYKRMFIRRYHIVIKSSIVGKQNLLLLTTRERKILIVYRVEILSLLTKYSRNICISGSHGKTSTVSLLSHHLYHILGSYYTSNIFDIYNLVNANFINFNIIESDESDATFIFLKSSIRILTNIDNEHFTFYKNLTNIILCCILFLYSKNKFYSIMCIMCSTLYHVNNLLNEDILTITYSINKNSDIKVCNILSYDNKKISFNVYILKKCIFLNRVNRKIFIKGVLKHSISKSIIINYIIVIVIKILHQNSLSCLFNKYKIKYRFDKNRYSHFFIIRDYAHHPTEIVNILNNLYLYHANIFVLIEPHSYSRLNCLYYKFCISFKNIDFILILDTHKQKKNWVLGSSSVNMIKFLGINKLVNIFYCPNTFYLNNILLRYCCISDIIIFLGAGRILSFSNKVIFCLLFFKK